jgi:gag-polyprotein putative aspartyl protease
MIILTAEVDAKGRPVLTLFVAASAPRASAPAAEGAPARPVEARALIDTGASRTVVERSVLRQLDLDPIDEELVHTASSGATPRAAGVYTVQLFVAGAPQGLIDADLRVVEAEDLRVALGVEVLLGQDVLRRCLLIQNGPDGQFTLALPAPHNPHT